MRSQRSHSIIRVSCCAAAAACLLMAAASASLAQRPQRPAGGVDLKEEQRRREVRESMLRNVEIGAAIEKRDQKRIEAAIEQIKQDFRQIQVVRNEIARSLISKKPLDYKTILNEAAEVNKRADRLKSYLLPTIEKNKQEDAQSQIEYTDKEMQDALVRLVLLIDSFVENPTLKNLSTTDVEQSIKAGGDLLSIIELSDNIKKSAEKLNKSAK